MSLMPLVSSGVDQRSVSSPIRSVKPSRENDVLPGRFIAHEGFAALDTPYAAFVDQ